MAKWFRVPGVVIQRSWAQGLHPATSGICFWLDEFKSLVMLCRKLTGLPPTSWDS